MTTPSLSLYHRSWCGYCLAVRREADQLGIALELIDVDDDRAALDHLYEELGRGTVPVLAIPEADGSVRLLPESRDIIAHLKRIAAPSH